MTDYPASTPAKVQVFNRAPVIHKKAWEAERYQDLVSEIVRHLKGGPDLPEEPLIVEEEQRFSNNLHVVVSWTHWAMIPEKDRSAIILDAYEKARGKEAMLRISVAMGLTPDESRHMGIERAFASG